jgi:hypothetical protein
MARSILDQNSEVSDYGEFVNEYFDSDMPRRNHSGDIFSGIVSVTFSAFDPFEPLPNRKNKLEGVRYSYVGLKHTTLKEDGTARPPKGPDDLGRDFASSVWLVINQKQKLSRWILILSILDSDPIFQTAALSVIINDFSRENQNLVPSKEMGKDIQKKASAIFGKLSSGHKIVLLTLTRLVESVEERTLVLLNEPEAHLHPPLLSAFIRSFSQLLTDRNGVGIVATHSPVVLQEVPSTCVWKIRRQVNEVKISRPEIETFGENVGLLTGEIFGLEVTDSGFHKLLLKAVSDGLDYDSIIHQFNEQLGDEAKSIVRGLIAARDHEVSE